MTGILDQVFAATMSVPTIVSEQHDASAINFVNSLSDPGEMIRCGYLPEIRRQPGEQDAEYAARIRPIVMALPAADREKIMAAATKRAGLDTSTGKVAVMVAGKPAWHGLGVNVADAVSSADAIRLASLDWMVEKTPLTYVFNGETKTAPGVFGIVRRDTGTMLGDVGCQYEPIQNVSGFEFLDSVLNNFGARYESAGAVFGGKKLWMLVRLPGQSFRPAAGDEVEAYVIFTNAHDGTAAARCYPTSQRVVCANTLRVANAGRDDKVISIRHSKNVKAAVADAQLALGLAVEGFDRMAQDAEVLVHTPAVADRYFSDVMDAVLDVTAAQAKLGADALAAVLEVDEANRKLAERRFARKIEHRDAVLEDILKRYESETCGVGGIRGTAWSVLQAVTETVDHGKLSGRHTGSEAEKASRRFESAIDGSGDRIKQTAYEMVMKLAN